MEQKNQTKLKISLLSVYLITASLNAITANIPEIAKSFPGVPLYIIELIATIPSLFQMVGVLSGKRVARRIGYRTTVLTGLLCCGIGGTIPVFVQEFALLFVTRCLFGLGCGLITSSMLTMLIYFFEGDTRSAMIGLTGSVGGLGSALSSFTAGRLLGFGWNVSFAVYFAAFAVALLVFLSVPKVSGDAIAQPRKHDGSAAGKGWIPLLLLTLMAFVSTMLASFFVIKSSTLITSRGIGTAQDGSLAITFISLGSLVSGAMYGKIYSKLKAKALVLFYLVSAAGLCCGLIASLTVIYAGAVLIGWGLIAFTPYFQEKASRDFAHLGATGTACILVAQALGAFLAPYYGEGIALVNGSLPIQFVLTGVLYLALAAIAAVIAVKKK